MPDEAAEPKQGPNTNIPDEETLRSLVDQLPLTVYVDRLDETNSNVYTSPRLEKELGYSIGEWVSNPDLFLDVLHPDDHERVLRHLEEALGTSEDSRIEYRMIARDGRVRWYLDQFAVPPPTARTAGMAHGFLLDITEQKELEHALDEERQHLRSILDGSPTPIVTLDSSGLVTSWNLAAEALFGYASDEALDSRLDELVPTTTIESAMTTKSWVAGLVSSSGTAARCERRDGSVVEVEILRTPLHAKGERRGELVVYHDVTAVRQAETRFRRLAEELPLVTYIDEPPDFDPAGEADSASVAGEALYMSPQVEGMFGYPAEDWADNTLWEKILHPDDRERVLTATVDFYTAGKPYDVEYRLIGADGSVIWVHDQAVVVRDEAGRPLYSQGFWVDITERKRLEEALRSRETELAREKHYFQSLVEVSPVAVVTMDSQEVVTGWNPAAVLLFGYEEDDAIGRTITELVLDSEKLSADAAIRPGEALAAGRIDRVTQRKRKDGTLVDVELSMVPLRVDGEHRGFYAIYRDITERVRSERTQVALRDIAETASAAEDMAAFYAEIHRIVGGLMFADNFFIALYDEESDSVNFPYYRDEVDLEIPDPHDWEQLGETPLGRGLTAYVLRTGQPVLVDPAGAAELRVSDAVEIVGSDSIDWLGVPLRAEGTTLGALVVQTYRDDQRLTERDRDLLAFVGQHIGTALARTRLRSDMRLVVEAASAVEAESFEPASLDGVAARDDALGQLARVFQRMAREVFDREQRLKAEVKQLRIEIDEARAVRQVAEITDTDYFRELQEKASSMRLDAE